jgi:tryptophan halogenase
MPIPETLQHQIDMFRATSHVAIYDLQGFQVDSHASIMLGHGIRPERGDQFIERMDMARLADHFRKVRATVQQVVGTMPDHADFLAQVTGAARNA